MTRLKFKFYLNPKYEWVSDKSLLTKDGKTVYLKFTLDNNVPLLQVLDIANESIVYFEPVTDLEDAKSKARKCFTMAGVEFAPEVRKRD